MVGKVSRCLNDAMRALSLTSGVLRSSIPKQFAPHIVRRTMATTIMEPFSADRTPLWRPDAKVPVTIYSFPSLEPKSLEYYSVQHLHVPMRKDLLHLAVIFEADNARQGTAHVKNAWEVAGSHRKHHAQKGTGMARAGWRQSPIRRGGGKSHGPRNNKKFASKLTRKVYDQALRIALSYRYRRGELIVTEDNSIDLPVRGDFLELCRTGRLRPELQASFWKRYTTELMNAQGLGKLAGRTLFVTETRRDALWTGLNGHAGQHGIAETMDEVDIKDLLEKGRVVMERNVLKELINRHQSDLVSHIAIHGWINQGPPIGEVVL